MPSNLILYKNISNPSNFEDTRDCYFIRNISNPANLQNTQDLHKYFAHKSYKPDEVNDTRDIQFLLKLFCMEWFQIPT